MSIQYEHLRAWNKLKERMEYVNKNRGTCFISGKLTAHFRMKFETLSALFWSSVKSNG